MYKYFSEIILLLVAMLVSKVTMLAAVVSILCVLHVCHVSANDVINKRMLSYSYELIKTVPHDSQLFTQGLEYFNGKLIESGGLYKYSTLNHVSPESGDVTKQIDIPSEFFAEGITVVDGILYMLTWRERKVLVFDADTFNYIGHLRFMSHSKEGWGLTHNARRELIVSDGSHIITFYKVPEIGIEIGPNGDKSYTLIDTHLEKIRSVAVFDPVTRRAMIRLNELEYVDTHSPDTDPTQQVDTGLIYANIWYKDEIIAIRASDGVILHRWDVRNLFPHPDRMNRNKAPTRKPDTPMVTNVVTGDADRPETTTPDCLNGIAYNAEDDTFVLTGKWWPQYFHVKLRHY